MTEEENQSDSNIQEKDKKRKNLSKIWSFCPGCGDKIPENKKFRYCMGCGLDLVYLAEHKEFPPEDPDRIKEEALEYPPYEIPSYQDAYSKYPSPHKSFSYAYKRRPVRQSNEELMIDKDRELWGVIPNLGITFLAYLAMVFVGAFLVLAIIPVGIDIDAMYDFVMNPYFIILSSLIELIFIVIPVLYVGRFLREPTLKNRLNLLGFTREEYDNVGVLKEVGIGFGFALFGIMLVGSVSLAMESLIQLLGFPVVYGDISSDVTAFINQADILALILLIIVMLVVIGISEEILFRGFMQKGFVRSFGNKAGIIITAIIFTMVHVYVIFGYALESPTTFAVMFLLMFFPYLAISLMLGLLFHWRDENLIAVIVAHGVYDALTIVLAWLYFNIY